MKRRTIEEIAKTARVENTHTQMGIPGWALRRRRLERLATLLESAREPVRLFTTMECYRRRERLALRQAGSPLSIAFQDDALRREGLADDSVGAAVDFFGLSMREAHALLCDCGYGGLALIGRPIAHLVASRARGLAAKRSIAELRFRLAEWLS
ncbi:MAG: hypothetical protein CTY15_05980 [Methylocystis sp.]|nr:MAG: hypothetical protein CTY15_05980 [Methylocystis sp.]